MNPDIDKLHQLVSGWRANGSPKQDAFPWILSKTKWTRLAEEFGVEIDSFPELIDREYLWQLSSSAESVKSSFLGVMVWGYGDIGYGPHRVRQMYQSEGFEQSIRDVWDLCRAGESIEAYKKLRQSHIRQLGPSFGSKVLTFFHEPGSAPAILDSIVAKWVNEYAPSVFGKKVATAETWNVNTYERYINWMKKLSAELNTPATVLEQLIFDDGYKPTS